MAQAPPKHPMTQHPLGVVVRRFHPFDSPEGVERRLMRQDLAAGVLRAAVTTPGAHLQPAANANSDRGQIHPEAGARDLAGLEPMPLLEHLVRFLQQPLSDCGGEPLAIGHAAEVADQVRPAKLAKIVREVVVDRVAIGMHDAAVFVAQHGASHLLGMTEAMVEERHLRIGQHPQVADPLWPVEARLIDVKRSLFSCVLVQSLPRLLQCLADSSLNRGDRSEAHLQAEELLKQNAYLPMRQAIPSREHRAERMNARSEGRRCNRSWQGGPRADSAVLAAQPMQPIYSQLGAYRRQVPLLMALRLGVGAMERSTTAPTALRKALDEPVHTPRLLQLPIFPRMALLSSAFASAPLLRGLASRRRGLRGGRPIRVARILFEPLFERQHFGAQPCEFFSQRCIDRLLLRQERRTVRATRHHPISRVGHCLISARHRPLLLPPERILALRLARPAPGPPRLVQRVVRLRLMCIKVDFAESVNSTLIPQECWE